MSIFRRKGNKAKKCRSNSGVLMGYKCQLERGHEGEHYALTSVTTNAFDREVGRTEVTWRA